MATILKRRATQNTDVTKCYDKLDALLTAINEKEIPEKLQNAFNKKITTINNFSGDDKTFIKLMNKSYKEILFLLRTELKIVPKNYYTSVWMALGVGAFGTPIGLLVYNGGSNPSGIAMGLPFGLVIGMLIGTSLDKKAKEQNRQL